MVKSVFSDKKGLVQSAGSGVTIQNSLSVTGQVGMTGAISVQSTPLFGGGLSVGAQAVTAAGSNQGDAAAISATGGAMVVVTGADNTKAVLLPSLASVGAGNIYFIQNSSGNTLEVFPSSGDKVSPAADDAAITVAANSMLVCIAADATQWFGFEPTVVGA
jgi:hypothetical protein